VRSQYSQVPANAALTGGRRRIHRSGDYLCRLSHLARIFANVIGRCPRNKPSPSTIPAVALCTDESRLVVVDLHDHVLRPSLPSARPTRDRAPVVANELKRRAFDVMIKKVRCRLNGSREDVRRRHYYSTFGGEDILCIVRSHSHRSSSHPQNGQAFPSIKWSFRTVCFNPRISWSRAARAAEQIRCSGASKFTTDIFLLRCAVRAWTRARRYSSFHRHP
jgi:hypothetical protein